MKDWPLGCETKLEDGKGSAIQPALLARVRQHRASIMMGNSRMAAKATSAVMTSAEWYWICLMHTSAPEASICLDMPNSQSRQRWAFRHRRQPLMHSWQVCVWLDKKKLSAQASQVSLLEHLRQPGEQDSHLLGVTSKNEGAHDLQRSGLCWHVAQESSQAGQDRPSFVKK